MNEQKENIIKVIISAVLLGIALLVTVVFFPDLPVWANILIFLPSYLVVGFEILKEAAEKLFKGELLDEDFLMAIATIGAMAVGEYPESTLVMLFFVIGETFEDMAFNRSEKSLNALLDICPDNALLVRGEETQDVMAKDVEIGDIILIKAGDRIPLDGVIVEGETTVDTSALTGESKPKKVAFGESVFSGLINLSGVIKVKVTSKFENSTASRILELVKNATEKKAKAERFITKFARIYTPVVVFLAVFIAVIPTIINGNAKSHIYSALSFLVVSCPCALVIAVPLAFFGGIGCCSKNGILVKGSDSLEILSKLDTVVFDKTGTLTKGTFTVTCLHPKMIDEKELVRIAAAAERYSSHPVAISIKEKFGEEIKAKTENITEESGLGIGAVVDGQNVLVGSEKLMEKNGIQVPVCHHIGTVVHVAKNGEYLGHIVISDEIKEKSKDTVSYLKSKKIHTVMLTGDNEEQAKAVGESVGIDSISYGLLPAQKVEEFNKIKSSNNKKIAFVGDGINDAPVLCVSDVGIAMGALGSDAAIEAADVVIMNDDIGKLSLSLRIAKKSLRIAKEIIVFSIAVKIGVLILSAIGISGIMWLASFADVGVLVIAVLNAMRTLKIRK